MAVSRDQFELLAPGGDVESIKAAIAAGADAIYCGLDKFNARNRATNLSLENLNGLLNLAHEHNCKIFLTLNIMILESEIPTIVRLLNQLVLSKIDGVIIQDLGLGYILKKHFPTLDVHASTQLNTHNTGQILLLKQLTASRVNLSRELNITEIKPLAQFGHEHNVMMEVFVHGSYCISFSGLCYMSSAKNGASGNRGRCSQPCRDEYKPTKVGSQFPLNMKDNSAYGDLKELADAGVYSLKVEGRIKKSHYVYTVVDKWRKQIDQYCRDGNLLTDTKGLYTVFNRDFSNGFLKGNVGKELFIDNPRDNSVNHFTKIYGCTSDASVQKVKQDLYDEKTAIIATVTDKIKDFNIESDDSSLKVKGKDRKIKAVQLDKLTPHTPSTEARLSVLINSTDDISSLLNTDADIYFQLPMGLNSELDSLVELFKQNPRLLPWFPAILIGDDFTAAKALLSAIQPTSLITNNLGVAYAAQQFELNWIAGPQINLSNSYALMCIQEEFAAAGGFISNELSMLQMRKIVRPDNMRLFYSIYHPNTLMTSRQCFFQQTEGCRKIKLNKGCLKRCEKNSSIISMSDNSFIVHKQKGSHNNIFSQENIFNSEIVRDLKGLYSDFLIDLRDIQTQTVLNASKLELIAQFNTLINSNDFEQDAAALHNVITSTTNKQYHKGV